MRAPKCKTCDVEHWGVCYTPPAVAKPKATIILKGRSIGKTDVSMALIGDAVAKKPPAKKPAKPKAKPKAAAK